MNTEAKQLFLDRFSAMIDEDEHVAMVLDQAGWHGAKALMAPSNITFVPLPPYSPELNPVERVWLHLKERFLSHRLAMYGWFIARQSGCERIQIVAL